MTEQERHDEFTARMAELNRPRPEQPKPDAVTKLRWQVPDGRYFERTGEKRQVQPGDWHWCDGSKEAPEEIGPPDDRGVFYDNGAPHVCAIWQLSEDQTTPIDQSSPFDSSDPIDRLIQRVEMTREALQDSDVPLLSRVQALGTLHQAKALNLLEFTAREILQSLERIATALEATKTEQGDSTY